MLQIVIICKHNDPGNRKKKKNTLRKEHGYFTGSCTFYNEYSANIGMMTRSLLICIEAFSLHLTTELRV